jgi:hypothetical protein
MLKNRLLIIAALLVFIVCGGSQAAAPTPSNGTGQSTAPAMNLPNNASVVGKLLTNLEAEQAKAGDPVDVQLSENIKSGHDVLVKKGSILNGHITSVQVFSSSSRCEVVILFDRVTPKKGEPSAVNLNIRALAPAMNIKTDTLSDGRGMGGLDSSSAVAGHEDSKSGNVDSLSDTSRGVYAMPGVTLAVRTENGKHVSVLASTSGNIHLKKGAQLVLEATS